MKKKKNTYRDIPDDTPVLGYGPQSEEPLSEEEEAAPFSQSEELPLFFDDGEAELPPEKAPPLPKAAEPRKSAPPAEEKAPPVISQTPPAEAGATPKESPRPVLRFRVKAICVSGKVLPEKTMLRDASQQVKALQADSKKAKKQDKKEKKEKKKKPLSPEVLPPSTEESKEKKIVGEEKPKTLQEIFSEPPKKPEKKKEKKQSTGQEKKKGLGMMDYVRYAMLFVCFTVFLYSSYTLIESLVDRAQSRDEYGQLSDSFHAQSPFADFRLLQDLPNVASVDLLSAYVGVQPEEFKPVEKDESAQSKIDKVTFLKKNTNKDTVGWIIINGTNIDYPVVHAKDNDYYLRRSFYKKTNLSGTLFTDARNDPKFMLNRNTVIYGHNMNDGSMFNNLHDLRNEEQFKNCKIEITTPNGIFIYEVFSVHEAEETSEYFQCTFRNDEHFASWLEEMKAASLYQKEGLTLSPGDKILTLSTCMDPIIQSQYRWAVHAKLVEVINYIP